MQRLFLLIAAIFALGACEPERKRAATATALQLAPVHGDASSAAAPRTAIGEIDAVDLRAGTVTIKHARSVADERQANGPAETVTATPEQLARLRVGDVVEFKSIAGRPIGRLLSINAHVHRQPIGLPNP